MARSIRFIAVSANKTRFRCVAGIDRDNRNTSQFRFVRQKQTQLPECPIGRSLSLLFADCFLDSFADALEFFNGNPSTECRSFGNDALADNVIDVSQKTMPTTGHLFQTTLRILCSLSLEGSTSRSISLSGFLNLIARERLSGGISGDIDQSKIDSKEFADFFCVGLRNVDSDDKEPLAVSEDEIGLTSGKVELFSLVLAHYERNNHPTDGADLNADTVQLLESVILAVAVRNRRRRTKDRLDLQVAFIGFADLSNDADCHVRRNIKLSTDVIIDQLVQFELAGDLFAKCNFRDGIGSGIEPLHRVGERCRLLC